MLIIRCAACKAKLWRYDKIGPGEVLRCHKNRMTKIFQWQQEGDNIACQCGNRIGIDKGTCIKMIKKAFVYSGTKRS